MTIDREKTIFVVSRALAEVLKRDPATISENTRLFDDLGLDSTSVLEVLMRLEDELDLEFDTDSLEQRHFETVGTLTDFATEQG